MAISLVGAVDHSWDSAPASATVTLSSFATITNAHPALPAPDERCYVLQVVGAFNTGAGVGISNETLGGIGNSTEYQAVEVDNGTLQLIIYHIIWRGLDLPATAGNYDVVLPFSQTPFHVSAIGYELDGAHAITPARAYASQATTNETPTSIDSGGFIDVTSVSVAGNALFGVAGAIDATADLSDGDISWTEDSGNYTAGVASTHRSDTTADTEYRAWYDLSITANQTFNTTPGTSSTPTVDAWGATVVEIQAGLGEGGYGTFAEGFGLGTGGLEEFSGTNGSPAANTDIVNSGAYSLDLPSGARVSFDHATDTTDGHIFIWKSYFEDKTPTSQGSIFNCGFGGNIALQTDGDLELFDANLASVTTATDPITTGQWQTWKLFVENKDSGSLVLTIDGTTVFNVSGQDFYAGAAQTFGDIQSPTGADHHIDCLAHYTGAASITDGADDLAAFDYVGDSSSTDTVETDDFSTNSSITSTSGNDLTDLCDRPVASGETTFDCGATWVSGHDTDSEAADGHAGPNGAGDYDSDDVVVGSKMWVYGRRSNGSGSVCQLAAGNSTDGVTVGGDNFDHITVNLLGTSNAYYETSNKSDDTTPLDAPAYNEYARLTIGASSTGGRDVILVDWGMTVFVEPVAGGTPITPKDHVTLIEYLGGVRDDNAIPAEWTNFLNKDNQPLVDYLAQITPSDDQTPVEWMVTFSKDHPMLVEYLQTTQADSQTLVEWLAQTTPKDHQALVEWLAEITPADSQSIAEWLGSINSDSQMPVAWTGFVDSDQTTLAEWVGALQEDRTVLVEWLSQLTNDGVVLFEWLASLDADNQPPIEWLGAIDVDNQKQIEWLAAIDADNVIPVDWTGAINADNQIPVEFLGAITGDSVIPIEWKGAIIVDKDHVLLVEWTNFLNADSGIPVEWKNQLAQNHQIPVSWLNAVQIDKALNTEWLGAIMQDAGIPVEWKGTTVVDSDAQIPLEWTGAIFVDKAVPTEWKSGLTVLGSMPTEWMAQITPSDHTIPVEFVTGVGQNHAIPVEWTAFIGVTADAALPIEWTSQVNADKQVFVDYMNQLTADSPLLVEWLASVNATPTFLVEYLKGVTSDSGTPVEWTSPLPNFVSGNEETWVVEVRGVVWTIREIQ